jgi:hypothetical protein
VHQKPSRPYLSAWLRRTRKQLAVSGKLSEISLILSHDDGRAPSDWASEIRAILEGDFTPSLDLITNIDSVLAKPKRKLIASDSTGSLF